MRTLPVISPIIISIARHSTCRYENDFDLLFARLLYLLQGALDRFAQFFLAPLFTESATEREVNAVDSENTNYQKDDNWRLMQLDQ